MTRRLTLVIPSLSHGGAERIIALLASRLAEHSFDLTLITLASAEHDTYKLDPRVARVELGLMQESRNVFSAVWNNTRRPMKLRRAINRTRPDAVISFTDKMNILVLLAMYVSSVPVIAAERSNPVEQWLGPYWERLRRIAYPRASAVVVQTAAVGTTLKPMAKRGPIFVIPNPAPVLAPPPERAHSDERRLVAVMRLSPEKGADTLIDVFSRLAPQHPQWKLTIVGEGRQRSELEAAIAKTQLGDRIELTGWIDDPFDVVRQADLFVLPSRYEGFPNSLLEAMACGLPAVAFDCPFGPSEIVRHEVDGLLVPSGDASELERSLSRLMGDDGLRDAYGREATKVTERFSIKRFEDQWLTVIASVLTPHG